jgi:hypothetical protein
VRGLAGGTYRIRWVDPRQGTVVSEERLPLLEAVLRLKVPDFERDIACAISP